MTPGYLGGDYAEDDMRIHVQKTVEAGGGEFVIGKARRVDAAKQVITLESGRAVNYDVASFNIGSTTRLQGLVDKDDAALYTHIFPTKPIQQVLGLRGALQERVRKGARTEIAVIGGGAAGVEISANLVQCIQQTGDGVQAAADYEVVLYSGTRILQGRTRHLRGMTMRSLKKCGVTVRRERVKRIKGRKLWVDGESGSARQYDFIVLCNGISPPPVFTDSGMTTGPDGALRTNSYLQAVDSKQVFGGGDCIEFHKPIDRIGVYAVRQNEVLRDNVICAMNNKFNEMRAFVPQPHYFFSLNLSGGRGAASKYGLSWRGESAMRLKDRFDKEFIAKYSQ